jgi:hypothetical protein
MPIKPVRQLHPARREDIADLHTYSPLPNAAAERFDPFLLLNHHGPQTYPPHNHGLPFGPHPHRGMETVTFILAGDLRHQDSGGHDSVIRGGGVQWMTAGRGLIHAEVSSDAFLRDGGPLEILQLWVNLPARLKMTEPRYKGMQRADIPSLGPVNLIAGTWDGTTGPVESLTNVFMSTLELKAGARFEAPVPPEHTVFLYVVRGEVAVAGTPVKAFNLVELGEGDAVALDATTESYVVFGHARPHGDPVVWHGPFVMNTHEEISQAIRDYQAGKFNG